jgi:beta-lactamase class A
VPADPQILTAPALRRLADELAMFPALVSVWCGPVAARPTGGDGAGPVDVARRFDAFAGGAVDATAGPAGARTAAYVRLADARHYAASMMKVPVLAAMYRLADAGALDLDEPIAVVNDFGSAHAGAPNFAMDPAYDEDAEVWARLGGDATPRWLGRRMIVRSSNLATNLVLARIGIAAVGEVLRLVGMDDSRVERGITDTAGRMAGFDNLTSARDLGALFAAIAAGADGGDSACAPVATPPSCREMIDVLCAQEYRDDMAAGLPTGTRVAHKNGWVTDIRHAAGVVFPDDAPPYVLAVCTTGGHARGDFDRNARELIARIAAASWDDRHELTAG